MAEELPISRSSRVLVDALSAASEPSFLLGRKMQTRSPHPSVHWQTALYQSHVIGGPYSSWDAHHDAYDSGRMESYTRLSRRSSGSGPRTVVRTSDNKSKKPKVPWDMHSLKAAVREAAVGTGQVASAIRASTFRPREQAFTKLISVCGRWKQSKKALEVFEAMQEYRGVTPNTITYTALIAACSAAGDCAAAMDVFAKMKTAAKSNPNCRPNEVTYCKIITACDNAGFYAFAVRCFCEMEDRGIIADQITCCAALHSCTQTHRWNKAIAILSMMHEKGFAATVSDYYVMISHYAEEAQWEDALSLFLTMQKLDQRVDEHCCHALMKAFEMASIDDMAMELLNSMWEEAIEVKMETYLSALNIFTEAGKWDDLLTTMSQMVQYYRVIPHETKRRVLTAARNSAEEVVISRLESLFQGCTIVDEFGFENWE